MARRHEMMYEENTESLRIPADAHTFEGFQSWLASGEFPESGRIDFLAGEIEADMSPEDLQTHGVLKVEVGTQLHSLVRALQLGQVFMDSSRVTAHFAGLSAEPDVVVVFWETLSARRARYIETASGPEIEGTPDLIVEVVSRHSESKDRKRLPGCYAKAGIPELWLIDARGSDVRFQIFKLTSGKYVDVLPDADGWLRSVRLPYQFRLSREPGLHPSTWLYTLEHKSTA
jgi:Uma2 family endonuclease